MARSRARRKPGLDDLARAGWLYSILLAERLPVYEVTPANLALCAKLGDRFVVEHIATIEAALARVTDLEDLMEAVLPVLLPWAREEGRIVFRSRPPAPYR